MRLRRNKRAIIGKRADENEGDFIQHSGMWVGGENATSDDVRSLS